MYKREQRGIDEQQKLKKPTAWRVLREDLRRQRFEGLLY